MKLAVAGQKIARMLYTRIDDALYELDLKESRGQIPSRNCRILTHEDASLIRANFKADKAEDFLTRLGDSTGIICEPEAGMIAGYAWTTTKTRENEGETPFFYRISPDAGDLYIFDVFVQPEFRGQDIATSLINAVINYAQSQGLMKCFTLHDQLNNAMINVSERTGFRRIGILTYRRIGPWVERDTTALKTRGTSA